MDKTSCDHCSLIIFPSRNLRETCSEECGLDASALGEQGPIPLGDFVTVPIVNDKTQELGDHRLGVYFNDIGGRERIFNLVSGDWLGNKPISLGGIFAQ